MRVEWCGKDFELFPEGALLRWSDRSLILADLHFGKAASFRVSGVPVPAGTTQAQIERLDRIVERTRPAQIIILGDLLHAKAGRSDDVITAFSHWRSARCTLPVILVRGNHDRHAGDPPAEWRIECVDEPFAQCGLTFCHHPEAAPPDSPTLAGHIHPAVRVHSHGVGSTRARCYLFSARLAVLPAFGVFTGACIIHPTPADRVFGIIDGEVVDLTRLVQHQTAH